MEKFLETQQLIKLNIILMPILKILLRIRWKKQELTWLLIIGARLEERDEC